MHEAGAVSIASALGAIRAMKQVEGAIVGAGTVTNPRDLDAALEAGSEFIVSPGLTDTLGKAAIAARSGQTPSDSPAR